MKLLFLTLLFICAYSKSSDFLNSFSGDVDIYDMGTMGRGKNACSWHRSLADKQEVFYYLAMQPWRHLVWTFYDTTDKVWYKSTINEDASVKLGSKLKIEDANDYCRKEYAYPMPTYDIDWTTINGNTVLEAVDINGITCYKYPAQVPLAHIYLKEQYLRESDMNGATVCRFDFIGGKSITFRSFGAFSKAFIKDDDEDPTSYLKNRTKCIIDPYKNNVDTDLAIVLGISDSSVDKIINNQLTPLKELETVKQIKIYYLSGESVKSEVVNDNTWATLKNKQITPGGADAVINKAKNDLIKRIKDKAIYRGTIIALLDKALSKAFDAETEFDRNNITVHTVVYNPKDDQKLKQRSVSLLSVGDHYHEFTASTQVTSVINELVVGLRANLTERCNRTSCDGFCDGRDRCTCPMCCENTCTFTYCNTTTASCKPWPEENPKPKILCEEDCVGKRECKDFEGCVYTEYNPDCEPSAKCMRPYCDDNNKCQEESICEKDQKPSLNNMCWNYTCDFETGNCKRHKHGNACPKLDSLCDEYYCLDDLTCDTRPKECAKTAPYVEMPCYEARCNKKTGMCENALKCNKYSGCGTTADETACMCDTQNNFQCICKSDTTGFCLDTEICDSTNEEVDPSCKKSNCGQDLYIDGCKVKTCNEKTEEIEWIDYDCSKKVTITYKDTDAELFCEGKYGIYCDTDDENKAVCTAQLIPGQNEEGGCGLCSLSKPVETGKHKTYTVTYTESCTHLVPKCPNGNPLDITRYPKDENGIHQYARCEKIYNEKQEVIGGECVLNKPTGDGFEMCSECFSHLTCYKNKEYKTYTYNEEYGTCSYSQKKAPQCSECNTNKEDYDLTCKDKSFDQTYTFTQGSKSKSFKYTIPKECTNDQCIPVTKYNCMDTTGDNGVAVIVNALKACTEEGTLSGRYHYSEKWDKTKAASGAKQSEEFLKEAEAEAYCIWEFTEKHCTYCGFDEAGENLVKHDKCEEKWRDEYGAKDYIKLTCDNTDANECIVEPNTKCNMSQCFYFNFDYENSQHDENGCVNTTESTCDPIIKDIKDRKANYTRPSNEEEIECTAYSLCNETSNQCSLVENSDPCVDAYRRYSKENYDFGCKIPNLECNFDNLHCTFKTMTDPSEDTKFFQQRDKVVFGDLCYNYTCQETCDEETGKCTHKWELTEASLVELGKEPEICETVSCNPTTGKSEAKVMECLVSEEFPQIDEQKAECFECKCSYQNGKMVLSMRANTDDLIYELDACGNCKVLERKTGKQVNDPVPCILEGATNLTGAIAGASVAASVVFGLIGSMVVVSIGALQTYKLVSSAMKNVISTTLENPEFVAADNEATNVLNNE